jgi:Sigma-70 region 2
LPEAFAWKNSITYFLLLRRGDHDGLHPRASMRPATFSPRQGPTTQGRIEQESEETSTFRQSHKNREALAILFRRYSRLVGVAVRILRDASEADDLLQNVFLFVHRRAYILDSEKTSFRSWLVLITY